MVDTLLSQVSKDGSLLLAVHEFNVHLNTFGDIQERLREIIFPTRTDLLLFNTGIMQMHKTFKLQQLEQLKTILHKSHLTTAMTVLTILSLHSQFYLPYDVIREYVNAILLTKNGVRYFCQMISLLANNVDVVITLDHLTISKLSRKLKDIAKDVPKTYLYGTLQQNISYFFDCCNKHKLDIDELNMQIAELRRQIALRNLQRKLETLGCTDESLTPRENEEDLQTQYGNKSKQKEQLERPHINIETLYTHIQDMVR